MQKRPTWNLVPSEIQLHASQTLFRAAKIAKLLI